jgi:hypothetical protein
MKILGLSGKIQSGKTTVAEYLYKHLDNEDKSICGFSSKLKRSFLSMFGYEYSVDADDQDFKSSVHFCGKTNRLLMQEFGAKMREIWPDVWIENWKYSLNYLPNDALVIVPDVRFVNEVKAIQDMGGIVIRLTRNPVDSKDETETALDAVYSRTLFTMQGGMELRIGENANLMFDHIVDNSALSIDETNAKVLAIAKEYLK